MWNLDTILRQAAEYGFSAVDFRGYLGTMRIDERPEFSSDKQATARRFEEAGLAVSCFSSGSVLLNIDQDRINSSLKEFAAYAQLCSLFKTPYIRVFGGGFQNRTRPDAIDAAATVLKTMARIAGNCGAKVLLETHDAWVDSNQVKDLLEQTDSPHVGVLWDIHHPWRAGESAETTWHLLGRWIEYTHWKDARLPDHSLCMMGDGDLPLAEFYSVLRSANYRGYFTLEWEKKHHPELDEPEIAFPRYVQVMRTLANNISRERAQ